MLPWREGMLPLPSGNPLAIDPKADPILKLAVATADPEQFHSAIRAVVRRNPSNAEAVARADEARASRNEARALQYPTIDVSMSYFRVLDRDFSNDPQNILERSRPRYRTDGLVRVQQPILDFGTSDNRIKAGNRRVEASIASVDDAASQIALRGIASWYQVFGYRALVQLSQSFVDNQSALRGAIQARVRQGYAAPADVAQVESYIAAAQTQLSSYRRQLASAEAQYTALTGSPAPEGFGRAPAFDTPRVTQARAQADAETIPAVRSAKLVAEASRYDARVAKSNALPGVTMGVDAGRYGVFENARDYDIRGSVTLSQRLGGGAVQRVSAAQARSRTAEATYQRILQDAVRDAGISWADVDALESSEEAIRDNYLATRQSRDVLAERFRVARGTLFDLLSSETNYFNVAARYVETVTELDIARYTLLARRGKLLDALGIAPARLDRR
jgi:outer membrane protein, adhesin transport system